MVADSLRESERTRAHSRSECSTLTLVPINRAAAGTLPHRIFDLITGLEREAIAFQQGKLFAAQTDGGFRFTTEEPPPNGIGQELNPPVMASRGAALAAPADIFGFAHS